jgi:hypothetical protein
MFAVETRLHEVHVGEVVAGSARMSALFLNATQRLTFALALFTGLATIGRYPTRARYSGRRHFRRRIRIAYEVQSEGVPSLVFVHGRSCNRSDWRQLLQHFSRQF